MDEQWLKNASIQQLMAAFKERCFMIAEHVIEKELHDTEDVINKDKKNYILHETAAKSAQGNLDRLEVEIIRRMQPPEIDEEKIRKTSVIMFMVASINYMLITPDIEPK